MFMPLRTRASWLSGQPLGLAVVPDVYIMMQASRTRTRWRSVSMASAWVPPAAPSNALWLMNPGWSLPSITVNRSRGASASFRRAGSLAGVGPICVKSLDIPYVNDKSDIETFKKILKMKIDKIGDLTFWLPKSQIKEGLDELLISIK